MTAGNRLLDTRSHRQAHEWARGRAPSWVVPQSAGRRELVVLVENGGIDLGLRGLVDGVVDLLPGAALLVTQDMRGVMAARLREWLRQATDDLLEGAELVLNRYSAAHPAHYGAVHVLRNSTATYGELRDRLFAATRAGHVVDLLVLTHGSGGYLAADSGIDAAMIRRLAQEYGGPLGIRSVYMMSCVGASLNQAWLDAGARTSAGSTGNNNLPEPTTHFFWRAWTGGQTFETAVTSAYRTTVETLNRAVQGVVSAIAPGAGAALAGQLDVSALPMVASGRPEVAGIGTLTIATEALPAAPAVTSRGSGLVTTVLPRQVLDRLRSTVTAYSMTAGRQLSPGGMSFVQRWERPLVAPSAEGEAEMARRIAAAEHLVAERVAQPLAQNQLDALVCFACGIGKAAFLRSTALLMVDDGLLAQVPVEIGKWTKVRRAGVVVESPGLIARRRAEADLFTGPSAAAPLSRAARHYAYQQNPLAAVGIAEAVEWGLAAGGLLQSGVQSAAGGFSLTFDKAQRLLTPEARLAMPGARAATHTYKAAFLSVPSIRAGTAHAEIVVAWGGNAYGEIESVVFRKDIDRTSDWSRSDLRVAVTLLGRVPTGVDPRAWPFTFRYDGSYDPLGNGMFDFEGEIEVDAFGGIRWVRPHKVVSHSMADWAIDGRPEDWVVRGPDVPSILPAIPAEQAAYLRQHLPG